MDHSSICSPPTSTPTTGRRTILKTKEAPFGRPWHDIVHDLKMFRNVSEAAFGASDASGAWDWKTAY